MLPPHIPIVIQQVGLVVRDLEKAMQNYCRTAGLGPWNVYTTGAPPLSCVYHGHPASYQIRMATAKSGPLQVELIEYISGDTIHRDFLASGREGIEHVGVFVPNLEQALQPYQDLGVGILQRAEGLGVNKDGCYAYLDTEAILGTILEFIQSSSQPIPPDQVFPMIY